MAFMTHYMAIICFLFTHQSLVNFIISFSVFLRVPWHFFLLRYTPRIFQSFYSFSEAERFFISSRITNPGQHSVIVASDLKLKRWSYLISNAIDIKKETLREKNTSIMIMSRKKCYICGAILSLPNRNREKQNA